MENSRNELSDIVLEKGDNKTLKVKRLLILVAFLILVFLVALASMKMLNKDQGKDTSKLILPPEPTSQEAQIPKDDQLFKQVPIIEENPKKDNFEDMIKTLKEKEIQKQEETKIKEPATTTKTEVPKGIETKPKEATPATPKKEVVKPKETTPAHSSNVEAGVYVQVGAVTTAPEQKVLNDIKSKGFEYKIYPTVINGNNVTKILIGPYASSAEAENALATIRSSINKNAFIYRIK
ncbi:MAG: SPOR domain-containing protein [Campylobacteraceae bacterium]|nr:SPOR domain-containing protein [Campylobacteraceae bacterium]